MLKVDMIGGIFIEFGTWQNILRSEENANLFVVELGALLHDIADSKFNDGDEEIGPRVAKEFLQKMNIEQNVIEHVEQIILNISFKGGKNKKAFTSLEFGCRSRC